jgi:very-short-patch-repair endonuclease
MLRGAKWQRLFHDVYIRKDAFKPHDHQMWCDAVLLTLPPGSCFGGWSAAYLWGIDLLPPNAKVWINLPFARRCRPRDRVMTRRTPLPQGDLHALGKAPVTTPIRTAFDLGRFLPRTEALVALDSLCRQRLSVDDLKAFATDRWTWPGSRQLRQLLPLIQPLSESPMETRLRLLLLDGKLPQPSAQFEVWMSGLFVGRLDLAYPESKLGIEYEGDHHRERHQFQLDVARLNALTEAGWLILRFTADDVFRQPDRVLSQVRKAIRDRSLP